jgi:aryl-alcohol dehydrogenase-like predicted oxidoreductase
MKRFQSSLAAEAITQYDMIAKEAGLTLTQLALAWCKSRWFVASTIIGATSVEQLEENIDAFSIELDKTVVQKVNQVYARFRDPSRTS